MLQIFILTKDRPKELREALVSVINQDSNDFEIIVSDNSDSSTTYEMMLNEFNEISYIKRNPTLDASIHSKTVIEEASAEYLMLFHDDDALKPSHVSEILKKFKQHPDVVSIASNGTYIGDTKFKNKEIMNLNKEVFLNNPIELFDYYLGLHPSGTSVAPLPGYVYKTSVLKKVNENFFNMCGKHADVQTLAEILEFGNILWLPTKTILYRVHAGQHSASEKIYDRNKLLRYMYSKGLDAKSKGVVYFKFRYLLNWWNERKGSSYVGPIVR